ncbi:MAG: hypothetical protein O6922_01950 [Chloroflexi bacterium]|nr:hypothetical protein [Chloroflexota bacterium]
MFGQPLLIRYTSIIALVFIVTACQEADTLPATNEPAATPELPVEVPEVASRSSESSRSVNSPIGLRYEILGEPRVGEPLQIRITSQSQVELREMLIQVRGDEGLWVLPSTANFRLAQVAVGEPITRTVTVTPLAEGSHRLSVSAQGEINGLLQANNVTIRIQMGGARRSPEPVGALRADGEDEAIISLPLQESP